VVIDFFDGNIDRPFVVGRIHEAQRHPTKFDNKGKLPDTALLHKDLKDNTLLI
jgi:type VI secretion system secreted protein VgrG